MKDKRKPYKPDVAIIDGNAIAFRSLFSLDMLSIPYKGKRVYTGIPFGFLKTLVSIKKELMVKDKFIIAWDGGSKSKKEIYPDYKKGRKFEIGKISFDDIIFSLDICKTIIRYLGITQYRIRGEEGDDIISSYVHQNTDKETLIVSNDHDMFQLLDINNTKLLRYKQSSNRIWNQRIFTEEYGFKPNKYPHYLSIIGDKTDNIPGIRGIGEVTAKKIFEQMKEPTLDKLYKNIDQLNMTQNVRDKIKAGREDAYNFLKIITLKTDLELEPMFKPKLNREKFVRYLKRLKFKSILQNIEDMTILCDIGE